MAIGVYKVRILYKNPKCRNYWGEFHRSLRKRRNNVEKLSGCFEIKVREICFFWGLGYTYFMWEGLKFTPQTDGSKKFTLKNVYLQSGYLITRPWVWTLRGQGHFSFCKRTLQMENLEVYMRNFDVAQQPIPRQQRPWSDLIVCMLPARVSSSRNSWLPCEGYTFTMDT